MPGPAEGTRPGPVPEWAVQYDVPMRDGVRLATDVYLPEGGEPCGSVLVRLPYDKNSRYVFMEHVARRVTARGYALVVQDVRGKYRSEGEPLGPPQEAHDGYDSLDWISRQTWSDGKVGTFGDSYYGFTQWAAASASHPALRAMVPRVTTMDPDLFVRELQGSVVDVPWLTFAHYIASCWTGSGMREPVLDFAARPVTEAFERFFTEVGERSLWYDQVLPTRRGSRVYPEGRPEAARPIPVLHVIGWYDNLAAWAMRDYLRLAARPDWGPLQYLYADSVDHENYHLSRVPVVQADDHLLDKAALERMLDIYIEPALDFFDVFLAERERASALPRVQWHLGHVGYRTSESWPPPSARETAFYLHGLSTAGSAMGGLTLEPPTVTEAATWRYNPDDLPPSNVENSFAFLYEYPDESVRAQHRDVLVFSSDPMVDPLDLAGPVRLTLRVDSSGPTTDVFVRVCDAGPDGTSRLIVRGQAVVHELGDSREHTIEVGHAGYRLRAGHALELHLSSSDYPEYVASSGTEDDRWTAVDRAATTQTLYSDPARAAVLTLTTIGE